MIFRSNFPDVDIEKIGIYQFITSNPYGIDDDKVIFIDGITDKKLTFGQLKTNSKKLAFGLKKKIDYPVVIFGEIAAGGIVTTVNPDYEYEEFASQLKDCGASVIICHPVYLSKTIEAAKAANIHESKIFLFDENEIQGLQPFLSLFSNQEINPVEYTPEEAESTTAYLCYSSGTTGKSKGIENTHFNMVSNLTQINVFEDQINHENIFMGSHDFFHIYGLTFLVHFVIIKGASCVILCKFKFELETFCRIIQDYKVNIAPIVPPIIWLLVNKINLIKERKYDLSSLKLIISSAAPLSGDLCKEFVETYNVPIKQAYGLTEATPFATATKTHEIVDGSIGILIPNMECKVISENNKELGYNKSGEFCFRGPNIMKGYLNNEKATDTCIDSDGWFHTGDFGFVDPQGNFFIVDRFNELIKYKEFRIIPTELESILLTHSSINDSAVIGIYSDEQETEYPLAYVELKPDKIQSDQLKEEIKDFVSQKVAPHKKLHCVHFIDKIPKSSAGKTLRRSLRAKNECVKQCLL
ncbi:acetate--CoA ligase ACS2 [Rhizophagus irregularis DAOM 197198w]|uniref:Acetate--CoA ligase ACS2 n=2 Tax=Rhizophagus irregularis TaxID=588596 RepID=A0A015IMB6_RHIIW|nr:acetate--CoA ligase ACS2 [Rhizophagus irregularis DAOM 197198w]